MLIGVSDRRMRGPKHRVQAIDLWRVRQPLAIDPDRLTLTEPEDLLGEGSFGKVVAGRLRSAGRDQQVAVKMLPAMTMAEQRVQFNRCAFNSGASSPLIQATEKALGVGVLSFAEIPTLPPQPPPPAPSPSLSD